MGCCFSDNGHPDEDSDKAKKSLLKEQEESYKAQKTQDNETETSVKKNNRIHKASFVKLSHGLVQDSYDTIKILGEGGFGKVYLVKDKRTNVLKAMKEVAKSTFEMDQKVIEEIAILKELVNFI